MALTISMTTASAGLADSPIARAITHLAATVSASQRQGLVPDSPALDLQFLLPGQLAKPDFTGMRMGGYNPAQGTLHFEKAVPEHILYSQHCGAFVAQVMQDVVDNAFDFFQDGAGFDMLRWQQLSNRLGEAMQELKLPVAIG